MNAFLQTIVALCAALLASELLQRLCPEDAAVRFAGGLAALFLLLSAAASLFSLDWDLELSAAPIQRQQDQLSSYVEERYEEAAQQDGESYVQGLLAAAGLQAKEIRVKTDRNAQGSIVMTEVAVRFVYPSEAERARALLSGVLGDEVRITVETGEEETSAA